MSWRTKSLWKQAATSERTAKTLMKVQLEKNGVYSSEWSRPQAYNERLKSVRLNQLSILSTHCALEPNSLGKALHHSTRSVTTLISPAARHFSLIAKTFPWLCSAPRLLPLQQLRKSYMWTLYLWTKVTNAHTELLFSMQDNLDLKWIHTHNSIQ